MTKPRPQSVSTSVTEYNVTADCITEDHPNQHNYVIRVAYRGQGMWGVYHEGHVLSNSGQWEYEPRSSERNAQWRSTHRFDRETALSLAATHAVTITSMGKTAHEYADWFDNVADR